MAWPRGLTDVSDLSCYMGYRTTSTAIYFCMGQQLHSFRRTCESEMQLVLTKISRWTSAIAHTCYFNFAHAPNVFPFHACRAYSSSWGPWWSSPNKQLNYVNIEHTPLCYWLKSCVRVKVRQMKGHRSNTDIYCTIVKVLKYRGIFQVYNNVIYRE